MDHTWPANGSFTAVLECSREIGAANVTARTQVVGIPLPSQPVGSPQCRPRRASQARIVEKFRGVTEQRDAIVEDASGRPLQKDLEAKEVLNVR
jgi:hypothetical protein